VIESARKILRLLPLLLLAAAGPAASPPTPQQIQDADRARAAQLEAQRQAEARAAAALAEEKRLALDRVAAAARLRDLEGATADAATRVEALAHRRLTAEQRLQAHEAQIAPLLPLFERLSLYPAETLLAVPMPAEEAVTGMLLLGGITRQLETEAATLRTEQAEVAAAQAALDAEAPKLAAARAAQADAEAALDAQIAAARQVRLAAQDEATAAAQKAAAEAARADSLRAALAKIEAEQRAAETRARADAEAAARQKRDADAAAARKRQEALAQPAGPGVGAPKGALTAPVTGTVARAFGEPTDAGPANGVSYQAAPNARVVSPCGGRVVFAAPFRSFGLLLIVDCGGGYDFVLAGFSRLDAQVGQSVQAGEPVGVMADWDPRNMNNRPTLYMELRKDGLPVNPAPFLRAKS
jgi:septal ring factor EnvC (AmiA/AmiB activator)